MCIFHLLILNYLFTGAAIGAQIQETRIVVRQGSDPRHQTSRLYPFSLLASLLAITSAYVTCLEKHNFVEL